MNGLMTAKTDVFQSFKFYFSILLEIDSDFKHRALKSFKWCVKISINSKHLFGYRVIFVFEL